MPKLSLEPIGVVRTPFRDKQSAPRQPAAARGVRGTIELHAEAAYEHGLEDLDGFSHIWVLFWFDRNDSWNAKVLPPRSQKKRGVFATRSPHRPNPLGLSVLRLERIEGRTLHVLDVDMLDETPVLDLKPYVAYTDAVPEASNGWLEESSRVVAPGEGAPVPRCEDPVPRFIVTFSERAEAQLAWLALRTPLPLGQLARDALALGPSPHPYRRIRDMGDHLRLAIKDFRVRFVVQGERVHVLEIASGYKARVLGDPRAQPKAETPLSVHRDFVACFGTGSLAIET